MDDLDQLRNVFGDDAERVYRGMQELYGEMSMSEALELVLQVIDKERRGDRLDERERRVRLAMEALIEDEALTNDSQTPYETAILAADVPTSLGRFEQGTRVTVVGRLADGSVLVRAGIAAMTFSVPERILIVDP